MTLVYINMIFKIIVKCYIIDAGLRFGYTWFNGYTLLVIKLYDHTLGKPENWIG